MTGDRVRTTQAHVLVEAVRDGVVVLKTKDMAAVVEVTGCDISRMSENQRIGLLAQYERVLAGWRWPYQIVVGRKQQNLDVFCQTLADRARLWEREGKRLYSDLVADLLGFMDEIIKGVNPQVHRYLVVLPYDPLSPADRARRRYVLPSDRYATGLEELARRCDVVVRGLTRLGLGARRLTDKELMAMLHRIYYPNVAGRQVPPMARLQSLIVRAYDQEKETAYDVA